MECESFESNEEFNARDSVDSSKSCINDDLSENSMDNKDEEPTLASSDNKNQDGAIEQLIEGEINEGSVEVEDTSCAPSIFTSNEKDNCDSVSDPVVDKDNIHDFEGEGIEMTSKTSDSELDEMNEQDQLDKNDDLSTVLQTNDRQSTNDPPESSESVSVIETEKKRKNTRIKPFPTAKRNKADRSEALACKKSNVDKTLQRDSFSKFLSSFPANLAPDDRMTTDRSVCHYNEDSCDGNVFMDAENTYEYSENLDTSAARPIHSRLQMQSTMASPRLANSMSEFRSDNYTSYSPPYLHHADATVSFQSPSIRNGPLPVSSQSCTLRQQYQNCDTFIQKSSPYIRAPSVPQQMEAARDYAYNCSQPHPGRDVANNYDEELLCADALMRQNADLIPPPLEILRVSMLQSQYKGSTRSFDPNAFQGHSYTTSINQQTFDQQPSLNQSHYHQNQYARPANLDTQYFVPWQSQDDLPQRRMMIATIVELLQARKPDAPLEWIQRLPDMARRLEDTLYRRAKSLAEYSDIATLKMRLQHIAVTMGARSHSNPEKIDTISKTSGPMHSAPNANMASMHAYSSSATLPNESRVPRELGQQPQYYEMHNPMLRQHATLERQDRQHASLLNGYNSGYLQQPQRYPTNWNQHYNDDHANIYDKQMHGNYNATVDSVGFGQFDRQTPNPNYSQANHEQIYNSLDTPVKAKGRPPSKSKSVGKRALQQSNTASKRKNTGANSSTNRGRGKASAQSRSNSNKAFQQATTPAELSVGAVDAS